MSNKRHRFNLHYDCKVPGDGEYLADKGYMRRMKRVYALRFNERETCIWNCVGPREQLTEMVGWCDGSWADLDEKRRSTTGGLLMLGGACVAGWSRTQKPNSVGAVVKVMFTRQLFVRVSSCGLANFCKQGWDTP